MINGMSQLFHEMNLICVPYAGGGPNCFAPLRPYLPAHWKLTELSLPGRGQRYHEPVLADAEAMAADIWRQLAPMSSQRYALLGHSMGSLLAWLVCHRMQEAGLPMPVHLFLSGREGPSVPHKEPYEHLLPYPDFKAKLEGYGGIAPEITSDDSIFSFFEPMIRADFRATETWKYRPFPRLGLPTTVFSASEEEMTEAEVRAWQQEFEQDARFVFFEGGHFFLFEQAEAFVRDLLSSLQTAASNAVSSPALFINY